MAGIGVIADPFIRTLLGPKWIPVIPVFQILVPVGFVQSIQTTVGQIYLSKGRTDWMFRWGIVSTICLVISFVIGVQWGIIGVAASYAIMYGSVIAYAGFAIPFRLIGLRVRDFAAALAPQIGITIVMAAACATLLFATGTLAAPVRLVLSVSLGIAVYVGLMLSLKPPVIRELATVIDQFGHTRLSQLVRKCIPVGG
jgi:O-antigen/teichoic acid export membrane protein